MIVYTKNSRKISMLTMTAYSGGVWIFQLHGSLTYTDPYDSSVWNWDGVNNDVDEVLGVTDDEGNVLLTTDSLSDCIALAGSFYWDDTNGRLYVHWYNSYDSHGKDQTKAFYSELLAGYSNGHNFDVDNVFDEVFYEEKIVDVSGLTKEADLTKFGLVTFDESSYSLTDQANTFYQATGKATVGNPTWFYLLDDGDTELTSDKRIFTGIDSGYTHNRENYKIKVQENRFFQNVPICPNTANDYDGKEQLVPVAWGKIRKGIMLCTSKSELTAGTAVNAETDNTGYSIGATSITLSSAGWGTIITDDKILFDGDTNEYTVATGDSDVNNGGTITIDSPGLLQAIPATQTGITVVKNRTATFKVADSTLSSVLAIDNVYDAKGVSVNIVSKNLTSCTVTVDLLTEDQYNDVKDFTWSGQGYLITGTYNNGLDIIKDVYLKLLSIPYIESTFERGQWNSETIKNDESVGISIQSDKGFIEELVEPITASLQGVVEILGNGKISFSSRDTSNIASDQIPVIYSYDQIEIPEIEQKPDEVVSELVLQYAPNFKDDDDVLQYVYTTDKVSVITNYGINRRDPLSPVETILTEQADVISLAQEIMETSNQPARYITVESTRLLLNSRLFSIVGIDTGLLDNENIEYGELLSIEPNYNDFRQTVKIRVIPDYTPIELAQGTFYGEKIYNDFIYGVTEYE
jgi:hypothetical protein